MKMRSDVYRSVVIHFASRILKRRTGRDKSVLIVPSLCSPLTISAIKTMMKSGRTSVVPWEKKTRMNVGAPG